MGRLTSRKRITRLGFGPDGQVFSREKEETMAMEEPLEIRLGHKSFSVTMRTPGHDFDLVAGFLVSEGVIRAADQLTSMRFCAGEDENGQQTFNVVEAGLGAGAVPPDLTMERHVYTSSSCGICGTASIEAVEKSGGYDLSGDTMTVKLDTLLKLPDTLRESQALFSKTGGVHAAGLFTAEGELLCLREDVGRHNAVDKVVGWALREGKLPLSGTILQVSGRASFELVQKAWMAGIPVLSAVSAPSSLAVDLAERAQLTLAGFSRTSTVNVYTGVHRIVVPTTIDALT